jgi:hypothetical protein
MAQDTADRPGIEERLLSAANTSDLTLDVARRSPADIHLAVGYAKSRLGSALIHLRSEWDRCDKPSKRTAAEIAVRAAELRDKKGRADVRRATVEALVWHARAMRERAAKLSGRSVVIGLLTDWAVLRGIDADLVPPAVFHWLSPVCGACEGRQHMTIPGTPALSTKKCPECDGAGTWPRPLGAEAIHDHIKACIGRAKSGTAAAYFG